jgi:hypothetical protein
LKKTSILSLSASSSSLPNVNTAGGKFCTLAFLLIGQSTKEIKFNGINTFLMELKSSNYHDNQSRLLMQVIIEYISSQILATAK